MHCTNRILMTRAAVCASIAAIWLTACTTPSAPDAASVLRNAERTMGGAELKTIRFTASGAGATFGQAYRPGMAWPRLTYSALTRIADYENAALRCAKTMRAAVPNLPAAARPR